MRGIEHDRHRRDLSCSLRADDEFTADSTLSSFTGVCDDAALVLSRQLPWAARHAVFFASLPYPPPLYSNPFLAAETARETEW